MLRIFVRKCVLNELQRKTTKNNTIRTLSVYCIRQRHINNQPFLVSTSKKLKCNIVQCPVRLLSTLPSHKKIKLPALSPTMETGNLISWGKKEGDKLNEGDLLAEIETDKATMSFETPETGYLAKILVPAGSKGIPVGKLVCIIVENKEDVAKFNDFKDDGLPDAREPAASIPVPPARVPEPPTPAAAASPSVDAPHMKINLPALSPTMEVGTIVSWGKKEGDKLSEGDLLAEIETDKATMSFETPETGYLAKILVPAGTKQVPVGKLVCIIVSNQADVAKFKDYKEGVEAVSRAPSSPVSTPTTSIPSTPSPLPPTSSGSRVYASPMAKRLAEQRKVRLQGKGTGLYGSITSRDLPAIAASSPSLGAAQAPSSMPRASSPAPRASSPAPRAGSPARHTGSPAPGAKYVDIPLTNMRSTIAKRLLEAKQTIPHFYLTIECQIDKLMATRARLNKAYEKEKIKISVNDFLIKAIALTNKKIPECNSHWKGTFIRRFTNVDVSVAVSTDTGLITPIVFNADTKGLIEISKDVKQLVAKARAGKLQPDEFIGGTISISNLGMFNIDWFTAIINPPQSCIVAVGCPQKKLILDNKSEKGFKEVQSMYISLSGDHRAIDGAVGAQWLQELQKLIENPEFMLM